MVVGLHKLTEMRVALGGGGGGGGGSSTHAPQKKKSTNYNLKKKNCNRLNWCEFSFSSLVPFFFLCFQHR